MTSSRPKKCAGAAAPKTLVLVLGAVSIAAAIGLGRPAYRTVKKVRAEAMLPGAWEADERGDVDMAMRRFNQAYRLAPESPPVIRAMAEFLGQHRRDGATVLALIQRLEAAGAITPGDRLVRARVLLAAGRLEEAVAEAGAVVPASSEEERAEAYGVLARAAVAKGEQGEAERLLSEAVATDPGNLTLRLGLGAVRARSEFAEVRQAAREDLWSVAQEPSAEGLRALAVLGGEVGLPEGKAREYADLLEGNPYAGDQHRLEALRVRLQLEPETRDAVLAAETRKWNARPLPERVRFYTWLLDVGMPEYVSRGAREEDAAKDRELLRVYIASLLHQGRWETAETILERDGLPLAQGQLHFVRAHIAREAGRPDVQVRDELKRTVDFAAIERFPGLAMRAAEMAVDLGFAGVAESGFRSAAGAAEFTVPATRQLASLARLAGDTEKLLRTVGAVPTPEFQREVAYLKLLLGEGIETHAAVAHQRFQENASSPEWRVIAALAAWRMVDRERARALAQPLADSAAAGRLDVGKRAIVEGILGRPLAVPQNVPGLETLLLPEEKAFPGLP